ncbi:hypothetical protein GH714_026202 [Hevea brasiliensis]|uniref:Transcription elongation factor 1 homolog n=1 Tax=Hevea brasiliensis TaxID=3981 RepID=A0A6A6LFP3_HEVBR|nr:hypothetical protein GH714_011254 [Hevea brasiliensis]KAF2301560.1 hypothetical protein GH714_026202 [Hevea brasiliensis]
MARRRSKRVVKKPVRVEKLDTVFTCPFCNHPNAVECIIDRKLFVGEAGCRACKASFSTSTTPLTEPIDIYLNGLMSVLGLTKVEDSRYQERLYSSSQSFAVFSLIPIESSAIAMARRRSKRVVKKPVRVEKLDTVFTCPFCNHPNAVECIIDRKLFVGEAGCRACKASFSTSTTPLTEPIDIYTEWIDECVRVNKS